ncbi:MAG: flavodoxin [Hungatella sp.]|jgi:flavodoxin short chain|nr:flavodoxin [Hungatella sp.]
MKDIYVIYWSGTGNTEAMAKAVGEGIESGGAHPVVMEVGSADPQMLSDASVFALGCPAMGSEELEEGEMEPFVSALEEFVSGKTVGLFGSYDWGDGEWMRIWAKRMEDAGAKVAGQGVTANNAPDEEALGACRELGEKLAQ